MGLERMICLRWLAPPIVVVSDNFPTTEGGRSGRHNKTWTTLPPPLLYGVILQGTTLTNFHFYIVWDHKLIYVLCIYLCVVCNLFGRTCLWLCFICFFLCMVSDGYQCNANPRPPDSFFMKNKKGSCVSFFFACVWLFSFFYISFVPHRILFRLRCILKLSYDVYMIKESFRT